MRTGWKSPKYNQFTPDLRAAVSSLETFLQYHTVSGVATATTDGSGDISIPLDFATEAVSAVVVNGTAHARILAVHVLAKTGATVRVYDAAGAAVTGTSVTIYYIATGR